MSSASNNCCLRNSTTISGDGGADFSVTRGEWSRSEKFTAIIKIQIAASAAHAFGCGQKMLASCWLKVPKSEARAGGRKATLAAVRISPRQARGISRNGWQLKRCSNSSGFIKNLAAKKRKRRKKNFAFAAGLFDFVTFVHFRGYLISS
jgi:hypothetical protein